MNILSAFTQSLSSADQAIVDNVIAFEDSIIGTILNHVRIFGTGVALIAITVMSIAYFTADRKIISWCNWKEGSY